jgi:hypothetical protein
MTLDLVRDLHFQELLQVLRLEGEAKLQLAISAEKISARGSV